MNFAPQYVDFHRPELAPAHLDLPRATVDLSAELVIGGLWIADIEAKVTVYREHGAIQIDEVEIGGLRNGSDDAVRVDLIVPGQRPTLSTICADAVYAAAESEDFERRADEAIAIAERGRAE